MRILIADDDPTSLLIAHAAARSLGHDCDLVIDGNAAWEAFRTCPPDVVISDWTMPGLDGPELCARMRAHGSDLYTYFIMVTCHGEPEQVLEGMRAGADDFLIKPLNLDSLHTRLIAAARVTSLHRQLNDQRTELRLVNHELNGMARRDSLTQLGNRRALAEDLDNLEAQVSRYQHRYCLALLDIDHFKSYNDTYGHQAGDQILQTVASKLSEQIRSGDSLYRYGGEEFLCIFPEQTIAEGSNAVHRMLCGVERLGIPHDGTSLGVVTLSAGLAVLDGHVLRSASDALNEADQALYRAKELGRNRLEDGLQLR
jgi:diguanylate cyclase (GGDEF)-like protein